MNRVLRLFGCLVIVSLLSGCWDQRELNQVSIVTGMAVDKGKTKKFRLTVEVLIPAELSPKKGVGNTASVVMSLEGNTISELGQKMNIGLTRKLIYSHMRTVVISEKIAREGLLDFFEYMERNREIRNDFNVVIAKKVSAANVLQVTFPVRKVSTLKLHDQLNMAMKEWGSDPKVRLRDIISALTSEGRQPIMEVVSIAGSPRKGKLVENNKTVKPDALVKIINVGVFKGEKLIGYISSEDARNYLWTQGKLQETSLTVPCGKKKFFIIRVFHSSTHIQAKYQKGRPVIDVNLNVESRLDGIQCHQDLDNLKTYKSLQQKIDQYIQKDVTKTIQTVQKKYKVDIFGFGEDMMRQDYQEYKKVKGKWDEEFSRAKINVHVKAKLRRSGLRTKSFLSNLK
jgi:spore germination protein KC